jgi:predicted AAA+ superfamily ATPase
VRVAEEIPDLKLTPALRAVLRVLAANHGRRLPVATLAREGRLSATTVRAALAELGKARLVRHTLAPGFDRQPPRTVYWLTGDGVEVATGQPVR